MIANNFHEVNNVGALDPLSTILTPQQSDLIASMFPKLCLTLAFKHPAQFKFLQPPILAAIDRQPERFMRNKDALHLYLG